MKRALLFGLSFVAFVGLVPHVFAQGFVPLAPIPGLTDLSPTSAINSDTLASFFNNLYKYLIGIAATLAVVEIIWAGLDISFFHKDTASAISTDKGRIYNAIFGLVLVLSPALVFSIINPRILDLSLNLPPIKPLASTPANVTTGGGGSTSVAPPSTGCTPIHNGSYISTALCADMDSANNYPCPTDTTLTVSACKSLNPNTGVCDSGYLVSCGGKTLDTSVYIYTKNLGLSRSDNSFVPSDAQAINTFTSGCTADGGKVTTLLDYTRFTCPASANIPNYDANIWSGSACQKVTLTCAPN